RGEGVMKNGGRFVFALWIFAAAAGTVSGLIEHKNGRMTVLGISPDAWTVIAALLMFLATVALAYIAYNQYTTHQAQTRAYVGIEEATCDTWTSWKVAEASPFTLTSGTTVKHPDTI